MSGPRIASHHANDPWRPVLPWASEVMVQWGRQGIVFGKENSYTTAFFEAFPGNGFIRGEGKTLEEAEAQAFAEWQRDEKCKSEGGHRLSRVRRYKNGKTDTYTNGACFCVKCGAFVSKAMPPIVTLGDYKKPLEVIELDSIATGSCRPAAWDLRKSRKELTGTKKWRRQMELRARAAGIKLPPTPETPEKINLFRDEDDPYTIACRKAVVEYCRANIELLKKTRDEHFLDSIHRHFLTRLIQETETTDEGH